MKHALKQSPIRPQKKATRLLSRSQLRSPKAILFVLAFVAIGTIIVLTSRAAGPFASLDAGSGNTLTGAATSVTDASAFGGNAVQFGTPTPTPTPPTGAITHGEQLTRAMVGYTGLGITQAQLQSVNANGTRLSLYPSWGKPGWIPSTPYVYNNNPSNHGGVVPAGGMTIDGFFVPAGTWVSQFQDFGSQSLIVEGDCGGQFGSWPGIVFRGIRSRGPGTAPGFLGDGNGCNSTGGKIWFLYSDLGGNGAANSDYNEVPIKLQASVGILYRNYVSYTTTGLQINKDNSLVLENFVEKLTLYYGEPGPPGESGTKHLNGFTTNGGLKNIRLERNKIILQSPDDAGHSIGQTDAISFFQDFGDFQGTGTNDNGTVGYQVLNNYIGGGGYTIYTGMNAGKPSTSVKNMVVTGNKITTQWWPNGGSFGPVGAAAPWGTNGNVWSNNTWADGPKAGQAISGN